MALSAACIPVKGMLARFGASGAATGLIPARRTLPIRRAALSGAGTPGTLAALRPGRIFLIAVAVNFSGASAEAARRGGAVLATGL